MSHQLVLYILTFLYCKQLGNFVNGVTLTATSETTWENSSIVLYCINSSGFTGEVLWILQHIGSDDQLAYVANFGNTCTTSSFLRSNIYSINCHNKTTLSVTVNSVSRGMQGDRWTCSTVVYPEVRSNTIMITVQVPVTRVEINHLETIPEKVSVTFTCLTSECLPGPTITLKVKTTEDIQVHSEERVSATAALIQSYTASFTVIPDRKWNGYYAYCTASNGVDNLLESNKSLLNVTYPPDAPPIIIGHANGTEINYIEYSNVNLTCSVIGGNPLPRLKWSMNDTQSEIIVGETVTKSVIWRVSRASKVRLICQSLHQLMSTEMFISINVLYPPDKPVVMIKTISGQYKPILSSTVAVIEHRALSLNCSANSNPPVNVFTWQGTNHLNGPEIHLENVTRETAETLTLYVSNNMQPEDGILFKGYNTTALKINVLYPPRVKILENKTLIEGENLKAVCTTENGNPNDTTYTWSGGDISQSNIILNINNVSRNATGIFTCSASNEMSSTDETSLTGSSTGGFSLDVQFKPYVSQFYLLHHKGNFITVNENSTINFECIIEGNPLPGGIITFRNTFYDGVEMDLQKDKNSPTNVTYRSNLVASCLDAGEYTCYGTSKLYNGKQVSSFKTVILHVSCSPRISPFHKNKEEIHTKIHVPVTFTFTTIAYPVPPPPSYRWSRNVNRSGWDYISQENTRFFISTKGLQSNLTIRNVTELDFGLYKLTVENDIGSYSFTYSLIAAAVVETNVVSSILGPATGGAVGGLFTVVILLAFVVLIRRRKQKRRSDSLGKTSGTTESHSYQQFANDDSGAVVAYEQLKMETIGTEQHYQKLQTEPNGATKDVDIGQQKDYENLELGLINRK